MINKVLNADNKNIKLLARLTDEIETEFIKVLLVAVTNKNYFRSEVPVNRELFACVILEIHSLMTNSKLELSDDETNLLAQCSAGLRKDFSWEEDQLDLLLYLNEINLTFNILKGSIT